MNLTLNVDLPEQDRETVAQIGDLEARVAWFVGEQVALERWRNSRHEASDRELAIEAVRQAEKMKEDRISREDVAKRFLKRWDEVMSQVAP
jgi:hypothetical protein